MNNPDMSSDLLNSIREGAVSRDVQLLLSQGLFPVDPEKLFMILLYFVGGDDRELKGHSVKTLNGLPARLLQQLIEQPELRPEDLDLLALSLTKAPFLERVIRHKNVSSETIIRMAESVPQSLQEIIVTNVGKLIDHPEILDALDRNPKIDIHVRRRIREIRHDFFKEQVEEEPPEEKEQGGKEAFVPIEDGVFPSELLDEEDGGDSFGDDLFEIPQELFATFGMQSLPEDMLFSDLNFDDLDLDDDDDNTLYQKVLQMTVPQKIELGLKGNKEARGLLIRDANKLVKAAVVMSPKITESEILTITGMRDAPAEVLRAISLKREWMRKYTIVHQVVFNPHTPVGVGLSLLPRMNDKDLKDLATEKDVPDPIRQSSRRLYNTRKSDR